jgi:hypothetical protein
MAITPSRAYLIRPEAGYWPVDDLSRSDKERGGGLFAERRAEGR